MARAASFAEDSGLELTLKNFLDYCHLDPRAIYKFSSFSRFCARADAIEDFSEPLEDILTKAFQSLLWLIPAAGFRSCWMFFRVLTTLILQRFRMRKSG